MHMVDKHANVCLELDWMLYALFLANVTSRYLIRLFQQLLWWVTFDQIIYNIYSGIYNKVGNLTVYYTVILPTSL